MTPTSHLSPPRAAALSLLLLGCGAAGSSNPADLGASPDLWSNPLVRARPYQSKIPVSYDPARAWPLVIILHGYGATGVLQDALFGLSNVVDDKGFLYAIPDGTLDASGKRFWNATDACCDQGEPKIDDVAYLNAVIDDMSAQYHVDPRRIFLTGHSNGGFMSHRMACDAASRIAAIVPLAGDVWKDASRCRPSEPVAVLQVHGDADMSVPYQGAALLPSARESVLTWARLDGCGELTTLGPALHLDKASMGMETTTESWAGCRPGGAAALWTLHGVGHVPQLLPAWAPTIIDWMLSHPKP